MICFENIFDNRIILCFRQWRGDKLNFFATKTYSLLLSYKISLLKESKLSAQGRKTNPRVKWAACNICDLDIAYFKKRGNYFFFVFHFKFCIATKHQLHLSDHSFE